MDGLWSKVVESIHRQRSGWELVSDSKKYMRVWKNIAKLVNKLKLEGSNLEDLIKGTWGDGRTISLWSDNWVCGGSLRSRFPSLYKLEKYKQCKIGDRFWRQGSFFGWAWSWVKNPVSDVEMAE